MLSMKEARMAVRLSNSEFDRELQDLLDTAVRDLENVGIAEQEDDRLYDQALRMYLKGHFEPSAPEAATCREIYKDIKETLKLSDDYREENANA